MENDEQKITNTKKCYHCKQILDISHFTDNDRIYSKCNGCRLVINNNKKKNICDTCGIRAIYNISGERLGLFCKEHKLVGMINITKKLCKKDGCIKRPHYNFENENGATFCKEHAAVGMINVVEKRICEQDGCKKRPCFNYDGEKQAKYCKEHAEDNMINVIEKRKCLKDECKKIPHFNFEGEVQGLYCYTHKEDNMINVIDKRCMTDNCTKISTFNFENETTPKYCKEHAEPDMIDIVSKRCEKDGCNIRPHFNFENETTPKFCKEHAEHNMINIIDKKCHKENCKKIPHFNFDGHTHGKFCKEHAEPHMINIKHKKCEIDECKKQPHFNFEGNKNAIYCKEHAKVGMINIYKNICKEYGCNTTAYYGYCGQLPSLCAKHRNNHSDKNFLYTRPKRKCIGNNEDGCKYIAEYGKTEPIHCIEHKMDDDIYLVAQKCSLCCKNDLLNKDGLCITYCAPNKLYQQVKLENKKEKTVMNYLDKYVKLSDIINITDDKVVDTYCNYYRPDRIYDIGTHCIIIEVDEDQHKGKRASCSKGEIGELARMHEIQNAVGINCIFLRFNPDNFRVNDKIQKINMNERLKLLVKWIERCEEMKPETDLQPVKYKYLFYDGWSETDILFKEIDDTILYDK
jgi:hypothetical protein